MNQSTRTDKCAGYNNRQRAVCAEVAVRAYAVAKVPTTTDYFDFSSEPPQDRLADLLADLRHWARQNDLDFDRASRISATHFEAEVDEEQ